MAGVSFPIGLAQFAAPAPAALASLQSNVAGGAPAGAPQTAGNLSAAFAGLILELIQDVPVQQTAPVSLAPAAAVSPATPATPPTPPTPVAPAGKTVTVKPSAASPLPSAPPATLPVITQPDDRPTQIVSTEPGAPAPALPAIDVTSTALPPTPPKSTPVRVAAPVEPVVDVAPADPRRILPPTFQTASSNPVRARAGHPAPAQSTKSEATPAVVTAPVQTQALTAAPILPSLPLTVVEVGSADSGDGPESAPGAPEKRTPQNAAARDPGAAPRVLPETAFHLAFRAPT